MDLSKWCSQGMINTLHYEIIYNLYSRDPTNVGALELSVAGSPIKVTDVHIDTDYNTKLAATMKLQGKIFGWIVERFYN